MVRSSFPKPYLGGEERDKRCVLVIFLSSLEIRGKKRD